MSNSRDDNIKKKYLKERKIILEGFCIDITQEMLDDISNLYPDTDAIERYTRRLILEKLGEEDDF